MIRSMGYGIEDFGNRTYIVREIPAFMELEEAESFLNDLYSGAGGQTGSYQSKGA